MEDVLKGLRITCLKCANQGKDGNLQSVFSSLDILYTLYAKLMESDKIRERKEDRDFFVLSKGQANLAQLVVMAKVGLLQQEELDTFCQYDSRISMQADRTKFAYGVENSAGSLGHGFPMAVGIAMGAKLKHTESRVYCLAGDGEMNEGTMWEACIMAADKRLDNLCLIVDDNNSVGRMIHMGDLSKKLAAFGFSCYQVNGHDTEELESVIAASKKSDGKPVAILAKTVRGYGSKTLMENKEWFHKYPKQDELDTLIQEVKDFA